MTGLKDDRLRAIGWLALACACWGLSFPAMAIATRAMIPHAVEERWALPAVVSTFIAWRFWLAAVLYAGLNLRGLKMFSRTDLAGGLAVGLTFTGGLFLQMSGLRYALPSVSGFLTSLCVIFLPVFQVVWLRRLPSRGLWAAVGMALAGLCVFGMSDNPMDKLSEPPFRFFGELLTLCGTLFFTAQILFVDRFGPKADPARLTMVMFVVTATIATVVSMVVPGGIWFWSTTNAAVVCGSRELQMALGGTTIFSSVLAFHLMNRYQSRISPTAAGVVYCLEPIFATAWSLGLGTEDFRWNLAAGGCIVLAALLIVTLNRQSESATGISCAAGRERKA